MPTITLAQIEAMPCTQMLVEPARDGLELRVVRHRGKTHPWWRILVCCPGTREMPACHNSFSAEQAWRRVRELRRQFAPVATPPAADPTPPSQAAPAARPTNLETLATFLLGELAPNATPSMRRVFQITLRDGAVAAGSGVYAGRFERVPWLAWSSFSSRSRSARPGRSTDLDLRLTHTNGPTDMHATENMNRQLRRSRIVVLLAMIPMWSVSVPAGAPDHPWLANGRYRHFSGAGAADRARAFAARHGLRLAEGMGDRRGWLAMEVYLAELGRLVTITDQEIWDGLRVGILAPATARDALHGLHGKAPAVEAEALRARARCIQELEQYAASIADAGAGP